MYDFLVATVVLGFVTAGARAASTAHLRLSRAEHFMLNSDNEDESFDWNDPEMAARKTWSHKCTNVEITRKHRHAKLLSKKQYFGSNVDFHTLNFPPDCHRSSNLNANCTSPSYETCSMKSCLPSCAQNSNTLDNDIS